MYSPYFPSTTTLHNIMTLMINKIINMLRLKSYESDHDDQKNIDRVYLLFNTHQDVFKLIPNYVCSIA